MQKKSFLLVFSLSVLTLIGCNDDDITALEQSKISDNFKINDDAAQLQGAVSLDGAGVLSINSIRTNKSASGTKAADDTPQIANIALEQIAMIEPPVISDDTLRASHVDVNGDYAYISYLKEGDDYLGGIDIVNIVDKYNPYVVSRMTTEFADMSAVYFNNNNLYFSSAFDLDLFPELITSATVGKVTVSNGYFNDDFLVNSIPGFAGVDILGYNNTILGISGTNGVAGLYSASNLEKNSEIELPDLRSAIYSDGKLAVLSGEEGVFMLNPTDLSIIKTIPVKVLAGLSKRTLAFDGDKLLVSEGAEGVGIYDVNSGNLIERINIQELEDSSAEVSDLVTNAVSLSNGFILMANGGAGFGIAKMDEENNLTDEGIVGIAGSTNYIKAEGDYIFVASGKGGLRIIKASHPDEGDPTFQECDLYVTYSGNSNLNVNSNEELAYRGSATLKNLNVGGKLTFCGSLNVEKHINLNSNGEFNMRGVLAVGSVEGNTNVSINSNAILRIEGNLTIYGDLNLNSGSTLEFVGENSSIHVYGRVRKNSNSTIIGNFTDTSGKL